MPVGMDFFLLGALVAYSGCGGIGNLSLSNYARDKGYGMGERVTDLESVRPGDFIQFWHHSGSGHNAVFIDWERAPENDAIIGVRYWSTQGSTSGVDYNEEFFGGQTREQDPIYSASGHAIYNFPGGRWASLDLTYFTGGQSTIGGTRKQDLQKNWRVGGTYSRPLDARNSIKLYANSGVADRTGNSYDMLGLAWQHRWSG